MFDKPEIKKKFPSFYAGVTEFKTIGDIEEHLWAEAEKKANDFIDNQFILYLNEEGLDRMEKFLGINSLDSDTVSERRTRIYVIWNSLLPYTLKYLISSLHSLLGDKFELETDFNNYKLNVITYIDKAKEILMILRTCIPMNLDYKVVHFITKEFLENTYVAGFVAHGREREFKMLLVREKKFSTNTYVAGFVAHGREREFKILLVREKKFSTNDYWFGYPEFSTHKDFYLTPKE